MTANQFPIWLGKIDLESVRIWKKRQLRYIWLSYQIVRPCEWKFSLRGFISNKPLIFQISIWLVHLRSVESHFMLFSGVSWPKSASIIAAFFVFSVRVPWSPIFPKYFFPWALNLSLMLTESCRGPRGLAKTWLAKRRATVVAFIWTMFGSMLVLSVGKRPSSNSEKA